MKEYEQKIHNIINNAEEDVIFQAHQAYEQGYATGYDHGKRDGYADGKADTPFTDTEEAEKKAYDRGLADMLEAAKSMRMMTGDELEVVFGLHYIGDIFVNLSPSKIVSKYHAFRAQIKEFEDAEIKVGDEVRLIGSDFFEIDDCDYGICTYVEKDKIYVMRKDGSVGEENKTEWYKTGRHFDAIAEVLAELRGAE